MPPKMQSIGSPAAAGRQPVHVAGNSTARVRLPNVAAAGLYRSGVNQKFKIVKSMGVQRRHGAKAAGRHTAVRVQAAGGDALVIGSSGQTAARVVYSLLRSGFKVTAGVDTDIEEASEVLKFAKQLEILDSSEAGSLKLAQFNPLDADSLGSALRRGSRVVLVVGDQAGSRRPDLRVYDAVLDALLENASRIKQLVVVTPLGGGGAGFFGGSRGGSGSARLSPLEQRVATSGVPYLLVRAAPSDRVSDRYGEEAGLVVRGLGGLPSGLAASRAQIAGAVAAAMSQAAGNAIIEVGASPDAEDADVGRQVAQALADGQQEEEEEEEQPQAAPNRSAGGFFTIGAGKKQPAPKTEEEEEEEDEEEGKPTPAKRTPAFFALGGRKQGAQQAEKDAEDKEEEAPAPAKRVPAFSFLGGNGTRKISRSAAAVQEAEEEAAAPARPARRGFSLGTVRVGGQQKAEEQQEEAEAAPAKRGAFRFGAANSRTSQQQGAAEAATATRRIVRGRKPIPAEVEQPSPRTAARSQPATADEQGGKKKKSGGLLGLLGVNQETAYVDEL